MSFSDNFYKHFTKNGAKYLVVLLTLQLIRCLYTNLYPVFDNSYLQMSEYQTYMLTSFLLMISAMYFFLYYAVQKKRLMYIESFTILALIFNVYMIFREFVFISWPQYYFTQTSTAPEDLMQLITSWRYVAAFSIPISLISMLISYLIAKPTGYGLYLEVYNRLDNMINRWSKKPILKLNSLQRSSNITHSFYH